MHIKLFEGGCTQHSTACSPVLPMPLPPQWSALCPPSTAPVVPSVSGQSVKQVQHCQLTMNVCKPKLHIDWRLEPHFQGMLDGQITSMLTHRLHLAGEHTTCKNPPSFAACVQHAMQHANLICPAVAIAHVNQNTLCTAIPL